MDFLYYVSGLINRYIFEPLQMEPANRPTHFERLRWKSDSSTLFVYLHGLNGSPTRAYPCLDSISQKYPGADIYAPRIPNRCNTEWNSSCKFLLEPIMNYVNQFPNNPVNLICFSYGSLYGKYICDKLPISTRVNFYCVAGIFQGTQFIQYVRKLRALDIFQLHPDVIKNLEWKENSPIFNRENTQWIFIYTQNDERAYPNSTSCPPTQNVEDTYYYELNDYQHQAVLIPALKLILSLV